MQAPPPVADEPGRLEALQRYKVLETPPEGALDDLVRIAAYVCQAPIALLTLVDAERQWFKSRIGFSPSETPRQLSFCAHAIHASDLFVVEDMRRDDAFADHPLVAGDPFIRFYAGAPLRTADGHAIGALAVADAVPRQLTPEQLDALRVLGRQVMAQLELHTNNTAYAKKVYVLPKRLDEKVARLHLEKLGVKLTVLAKEQADYIGVPVEGPYKPDFYRY